MADLILGLVLEKLSSLIQRELGRLWGVQKEMEKLSSRLSMIFAVLEDAEEKQVKSKAIRDWLSKLKDAAYDADDVLDEWSTESLQIESSYFSRMGCTNQCSHHQTITKCLVIQMLGKLVQLIMYFWLSVLLRLFFSWMKLENPQYSLSSTLATLSLDELQSAPC